MSIKILVCDDHQGIRTGLASLFAGTEIEIVGEADSGKETLKQAQKIKPDVVLLDADVPGGWRPVVAALRDCIPADRIAVLASYWHADEQREAIATGIGGTLLKHLDGSALARQLRELGDSASSTTSAAQAAADPR